MGEFWGRLTYFRLELRRGPHLSIYDVIFFLATRLVGSETVGWPAVFSGMPSTRECPQISPIFADYPLRICEI